MATAFQTEDSTKGRSTDEFVGHIKRASKSIHDDSREKEDGPEEQKTAALDKPHNELERQKGGFHSIYRSETHQHGQLHNAPTPSNVPNPWKSGPCSTAWPCSPQPIRHTGTAPVDAVSATSLNAAN